MKKITPFLWFDTNALDAAKFYVSVFKKSKITNISRQGSKGAVMSVSFTLDGQNFIALNGGPHFSFSPAISMYVNCETQSEVDAFWKKLSKGGVVRQCGWVQDKFGLTWQVVPSMLGKVLGGKNPAKSAAAMQAMLKMEKLNIKALQKAYDDA